MTKNVTAKNYVYFLYTHSKLNKQINSKCKLSLCLFYFVYRMYKSKFKHIPDMENISVKIKNSTNSQVLIID